MLASWLVRRCTWSSNVALSRFSSPSALLALSSFSDSTRRSFSHVAVSIFLKVQRYFIIKITKNVPYGHKIINKTPEMIINFLYNGSNYARLNILIQIVRSVWLVCLFIYKVHQLHVQVHDQIIYIINKDNKKKIEHTDDRRTQRSQKDFFLNYNQWFS